MIRVLPLCALLCISIIVGCKKKSNSSGGGDGGDGGGSVVRTPEHKQEATKRLRQIARAMHDANDANRFFPAGVVGANGELGLSWRVAILPQLGQGALYNRFKLNEPWDSAHNKALIAQMPEVFEAPGVPLGNGKTHLRAFTGPWAFIPPGPWPKQPAGSLARGRVTLDISDGFSNSFMMVEAAEPVEWTKPDDLVFLDQTSPLPKLGGVFPGGFHVLMCDGSTRFARENINKQTLRALITVNGGELPGDW